MTPELLQFIENCKAITAEKEQVKQTKKPKINIQTTVNENGAMVGDVLGCTWGYEQTNYDFYEVIKVTAKTVTLKKQNGYNAGEILKNKRVDGSREGGYSVKVYEFARAYFDPSDPYSKASKADAEEEYSNPYRGR